MNVSILDCTLRDGGYVNGWNFGETSIKKTVLMLEESKIDLIEIGFLENKKERFSDDLSLYNNTDDIEQSIAKSGASESSNFVAMVMNEKYDPSCINKRNRFLKGIRYTFKKNCISEAYENCKFIIRQGFDLYIQPVSINDYTDEEVIKLVKLFNQLDISAFYIVDTSGTMQRNEVLRLYYIIDNNLKKSVPIGFHSHNNLQLSFSNSLALIDTAQKRDLYIDTSILGMGRGAGNLCTELMTQYINENIEHKYNLIPILETMDEYIMPIYSKHPWGYSAPYYIAAINGCHPNYATYLVNRQTLCIRDINYIIKNIPEDKKHLFDKDFINNLYLEYQSRSVDDTAALNSISDLCGNKKVLILAPGKSLLTYRNEIETFIKENDPIVFGINHIPKFHKYDRIFVSNLKRFKSLDNAISLIKDKLICTSNISADSSLCVVNYSSYLNSNETIYDNSGLILINILIRAGVTDFALAGYDGFSYADAKNYFDEGMANNVNAQRQYETNMAIIDYFEKIRKRINVTFITPTIYDNGVNNEQI